MTNFGEDWDRFSSRHLGEWHGRAIALSIPDASLLSSTNYRTSSDSVTLSRTNPSSLLLKWNIQPDSTDTATSPSEIILRYNPDKFHCFPDGSYSADHALVELPLILPDAHPIAQHAIEIALPVSATERTRSFMLYDESRVLHTLVLLEEVRSGMFDTKEPLALTSLVGEWRGLSETFRHENEDKRAVGFERKQGANSPTRRARRKYSEEDLPSQLKNPSGGKDGLIKTKSSVRLGWDPTNGTVRRSTVLSDMQDHELGRSVVYGIVDSQVKGLFDVTRFESNTATETLFVALNNGCFVTAPVKRVRGVSATAELGCLITPGFRRRLVRIYGKSSVASETLSAESLV